ncbi:MAG: hypothetical protein IH988_00800 [Planctomycetes bacterium]|nr:hypothetical protein [Planctomycetota bacterium]
MFLVVLLGCKPAARTENPLDEALEAVKQQLDSSEQPLAQALEPPGPDDNLLTSVFRADIDAGRDVIAVLESGKTPLPVSAELKAAIQPMALGQFREARDRLHAYLDAHPHDQMGGFCKALCELELYDFRAAADTLEAAFPKPDLERLPFIVAMQRFTRALAVAEKRPASAEICYAFESTCDRTRHELECLGKRFALTDSLTVDDALLSVMMLGLRDSDPLFFSTFELWEAAERLNTPWGSVVEHILLESVSDPQDLDGDPPAPVQLFTLLSRSYPQGGKADENPQHAALLAEVQRLDPDNGAWKLPAIPYDDTRIDPDSRLFRPLTDAELDVFFAALASESMQFDFPEFGQAVEKVAANVTYPYKHWLMRGLERTYNPYPALGNTMKRAKSRASSAIAFRWRCSKMFFDRSKVGLRTPAALSIGAAVIQSKPPALKDGSQVATHRRTRLPPWSSPIGVSRFPC